MASFPVRVASSFLLKLRWIFSVNHRSSAVSMAFVEGVFSVFEELLIPCDVFEGELSEKVTRALGVLIFQTILVAFLRLNLLCDYESV